MTIKIAEILGERKVNYWEDRISAQIEYAYKLSNVNNGAYDSLINASEEYLINCFKRDGSITKIEALEAEKMLQTLSEKAKEYKMICAAHAHIDMNWMWAWDETVSIALETFRTMLDLMNEYPNYVFSQSQASVYKIVEEYDKDLLCEIKKRVQEGRWEVTASTWVEADKNMPSGESLARHILYTKNYLSGLFNINPDSLSIDFEPDTFGHSQNVPEILAKGGVKYYYHCRGYEGHNIYKWLAPSGANVIVYREPFWYNGTIDSSMALCIPEFCTEHGLDTMLKVYGVGDHGGGPTRRDIERIMDMNSWPIFPSIRFGSFKEYFSIIENTAHKLPCVEGELNFVFDGCYTTQSRIKTGNRISEVMLTEAELFSSIASISRGVEYPIENISEGWKDVLFNQFHDIIPGSGTIDTREYSMGLYQKTMAAANSKRNIAFKRISDNIDTSALITGEENIKETVSEGAGVGFGINDFKLSQSSRGAGKTRIFHAFNPSMYEREEIIENIVWDWEGDLGRIVFKNQQGQKIFHQLIENGFNEYWGHKYLRALVKVKVPGCGYTTYVMEQEEQLNIETSYPSDQRVQKVSEFILENNLIKVIFDPRDASIISMIDKITGEELGDQKRKTGIFRLIDEDDSKGMTAWTVGRYKCVESIHKDVKMKKGSSLSSALRSTLAYEMEFRSSNIKVEVWLDQNCSQINFDVKCDWREIGVIGKGVPQLGFYFPVNYNCSSYKYDIPYGIISRKGMDIDVPACSFVQGERGEMGKGTVMLITNSKYGFRSVKDDISVTLLRSSYDPDPYPEFGIHEFKFALRIVNNSISNKELLNISYNYNHPISILSGKRHIGTSGLSNEFMTVEEGTIVVSAVKMLENYTNNKVLVRVFETDGNNVKAVLKFYKNVKNAYLVDINENKVENPCECLLIDNDRVRFNVPAFSLEGVVVEF
jgi:alpha-mannosidase